MAFRAFRVSPADQLRGASSGFPGHPEDRMNLALRPSPLGARLHPRTNLSFWASHNGAPGQRHLSASWFAGSVDRLMLINRQIATSLPRRSASFDPTCYPHRSFEIQWHLSTRITSSGPSLYLAKLSQSPRRLGRSTDLIRGSALALWLSSPL